MIDTIIFDFAGVVTKENFRPVLIRKCKEKFGLDEAEFRQHFSDAETSFLLGEMSLKDFWQIACKGYEVPFEQFAEVFVSAYEINPDMVSLIEKLKKNYHVVMLSDNFDRLSENIKNNPILKPLFERFFLSNEMHLAKKTPGCFEHVLKELGKKPDECVFTDDKKENIEPALMLGIHSLHFTGLEKFKSDLVALGVIIVGNS